jgi:hypothetical protein
MLLKRECVFPLRLRRGWIALGAHERARMNDATLVAVVLVAGGALFLGVFFWVTVQRVRELGPPKPPEHNH